MKVCARCCAHYRASWLTGLSVDSAARDRGRGFPMASKEQDFRQRTGDGKAAGAEEDAGRIRTQGARDTC